MKSVVDVVVVGTGFSGLGMAIELKKRTSLSFVVLEKADEVGGTWRENHYPGCACDVPSHLYSFSFEPNPDWSRMFSPQGEILTYLKHCADKYGIRPHIRFGNEVTEAVFDETASRWHVHTSTGDEIVARFLVFGIGALSRPSLPEFPGLKGFRGKLFHSARWDHAYDLKGKRVAVIGTGASAIQFVPQIAPDVARLHLFQRSPPWIMPKPDRPMRLGERRWFSRIPALQRLYRYIIYLVMEIRAYGYTRNPRFLQLEARLGRKHIERQIADPTLRAKVTPVDLPGCKRLLISDDYYPALTRPNVELVTEAIDRITETGVVTKDGASREVDAIILGTGFRVTDVLTPMRVLGRRGQDINDAWRHGLEAYLGTTIAGFPNTFMLMGPNTGLGHNSMVFMIESQIHYVLKCIAETAKRNAASAEVRSDAQSAFNQRLQARLGRTVWSTGCTSWYIDKKNRKNTTAWPGFTVEFWLRTRGLRTGDYLFAGAAEPALSAPNSVPDAESNAGSA